MKNGSEEVTIDKKDHCPFADPVGDTEAVERCKVQTDRRYWATHSKMFGILIPEILDHLVVIRRFPIISGFSAIVRNSGKLDVDA